MATNEGPISILKTPYQHLQFLVVQAAARARTRAAWFHTRELNTWLLQEVDKQATAIDKNSPVLKKESSEVISREEE